MTRQPTIVAIGGGGFDGDRAPTPIARHALALTGVDRPRICFIPTAGGDDPVYVTSFFDTFSSVAQPTWLPLFQRRDDDLGSVLLAQDAIYVGGGNTANMLAIWRLHGVDRILRQAWRQGTVLMGVSAGALCWFECGVTDSFGLSLAPLDGLLGFLPGSFCPHYDGEALRRPRLHQLLREGALPATLAVDDEAAVVFRGTDLVETITERDGAGAYRVEVRDGQAVETPLPGRRL